MDTIKNEPIRETKEIVHDHHAGEVPHDKQGKSVNTELWFNIFLASLAVIFIINFFFIGGITSRLNSSPAVPEPASINLVGIEAASCTQCASIADAISAVKAGNVKVESEKSLKNTDAGAQELIVTYGVKRLPALIVTGETDTVSLDGAEKRGDALVLEAASPPYYVVSESRVAGAVEATYIVPDTCPQCTDVTVLSQQLAGAGILVAKETKVTGNSAEGKALQKKYSLDRLPSAVFTSDLGLYDVATQAWPSIGTVEEDGMYVLRVINPPYINLTTGLTRGLITFIGLTDASCPSCYNVSLHAAIIKNNFGVVIANTKMVDVGSGEGKSLVTKYNVTLVPTAVLQGDPVAYDALTAAWRQVGTVEKDGSYVFRAVDQLQGATYKNLATGEVTSSPAPSQ